MYIDRNERCKMIREELKKNGINSKMVSVSGKSCGYSDSITVKIKDLAVNKKMVESIARKQEEVRYCHASGEILEGCNFYVRIEFDYQMLKAETEKLKDSAKMIWSKYQDMPENQGETIIIDENYEVVYFRKTSNDWGHIELYDKRQEKFLFETRYAAYNEYVFAEALAVTLSQYNIEKPAELSHK